MIKIKRIYEPAEKTDGYRVLVDRLWPRGLSKEKAHCDIWLKEVAPSDALRKWFNHEESKWEAFKKKYAEELKQNSTWKELEQITEHHKTVTLLYGAKDEKHNQAVVLQTILKAGK
ncbi:MAG TPA: DUF488 domain-containing protein [Chitinophagaceae bacterium]|nr:DUF488 domain-containing protein [Chitinophagaceae bacterium]